MPTVYFDCGGKVSKAVDIHGEKVIGISVPAGWETAALTFQTSADGVTYQELKDDAGAAVTAKVEHSTNTSLDAIAAKIAPWRWLKLRSGTSALEVAQPGSTLAKTVFGFGDGKTLTFTSGVKGAPANAIVVEMTNAADDTLAVSKVDSLHKIIVAFANTTASKNAAAAIEALVQGIGTVGELDVSAMTVAGSTEYDAAPVARTAATKTLTFGTKNLTFTSGAKGPDGNQITLTLETAASDTR